MNIVFYSCYHYVDFLNHYKYSVAMQLADQFNKVTGKQILLNFLESFDSKFSCKCYVCMMNLKELVK